MKLFSRWAVGVTCFQLSSGSLPFHSLDRYTLVGRICNSPLPFNVTSPAPVSEFVDIVSKFLHKNPSGLHLFPAIYCYYLCGETSRSLVIFAFAVSIFKFISFNRTLGRRLLHGNIRTSVLQRNRVAAMGKG